MEDPWIEERRLELEEKERRGEVITWREKRMLAHPPVPGPSDDDDRSLEARVRMKLEAREPLTAEERDWFRRMPGDKAH